MRRIALSLLVLSSLCVVYAAEAVQVRFYPPRHVYAYELDAARGISSIVVQNVALLNEGPTELTIAEVVLEAIAGGVAQEARILHAAELDEIAHRGSQLQVSGALKALGFQFGGARLLPDETTFSSTRTLKPNEALLLTQQVLVFTGKRDAVRVRVRTADSEREAMLPILTELSRTAFILPFDGMWHDGAGPSLHSHHRWVVPQEFAHDFTRIGENGLAHRADGTRLTDYFAYGQPVRAAAAGRVLTVVNDEPEDATLLQRLGESSADYLKRIAERQNKHLSRGARGVAGNHVLIEHGDEYSLYAHLKPGSVSVKPGDAVTQGQQIGSVGSSGSSTEPHLHFHVCDASDVLICAGIPARFEDVEIYGALEPRQPQSGDLVRNRLHKHR